MEQRAHRWWIWLSIGTVLTVSLLVAAFFIYWYVVWPVSPRWVINTSPWLEPQLRAWAKSEGANDRGYDDISRSIQSRGVDAHPVLLALLRSSDQQLRRESIIFTRDVSQVPRDLADELIRASLDPDPTTAYAGCWAMKFLPAEWSRPALKEVITRRLATHYEARSVAMMYLSGRKGGDDLAPLIIPDLHDPQAKIRASAVSALFCLEDSTADDEIRKLADDPDPGVRMRVKEYFER
jgi:hypothetical protein